MKNELDFIKILKVLLQRIPSLNVKRQLTTWEKTFAKHISHKAFYIYYLPICLIVYQGTLTT